MGGITKAGSGLAWRARHRLARTARDVPALPASGDGREGEGGGHHVYRPRHEASGGLKVPRPAAPDPFRCAWLGAEHGGEPSSPGMGRHGRRSRPGPRQPQDETTALREPTRARKLAQPCRDDRPRCTDGKPLRSDRARRPDAGRLSCGWARGNGHGPPPFPRIDTTSAA